MNKNLSQYTGFSIKKDYNSVIIKLNGLFYDPNAVKATCEAFSDICKIGVLKAEGYHVIQLIPRDKGVDMSTLGDEFCNHALANVYYSSGIDG